MKKNKWINSWVDGIYDYHHYHSNTHETLVIIEGYCTVQMGGKKGKKFEVAKGDVIIIPAGVSHKNISSSSNFKCIGAYPLDIEYDIFYGRDEDYSEVNINIIQVPLPRRDPIYGAHGLLFNYWK